MTALTSTVNEAGLLEISDKLADLARHGKFSTTMILDVKIADGSTGY